jgi:hypothetical protein
MDIVLGLSMAPTVVRSVLVEGENADGVTVADASFDVACDDDAATLSAADQVIATIVGTRENATQAGHALTSTGVTWTDPVDAAALREALATRKVENVMLVSAFMAAAALAQMVGSATGNAHTALLFVEPDTATIAVVDSGDGSITDVHKELISSADTAAELAGMVAGLDELETRPEHLFIVGAGVDIATLKPQLEAMASIPVSAPEEPETALAWGAALASANAPLFASSTAALAYAQDPATGAVDPYAVSPGYLAVHDVPPGTELSEEDLAYSAVPDEEADAVTAAVDEEAEANTTVLDLAGDRHRERRPLLLASTILAVAVVTAILALEVSLALGIRPSAVALLPRPLQNILIPAALAPAPAPAPVSAPLVNHPQAPVAAPPPVKAQMPAPPPAAPARPPVPAAPPVPVVVPPAPVVAPRVPAIVPLPLPIPAGPPAPVNPFPLHMPGSSPGSSPGNLPGSPPPRHYPWSPPPVHQPVPVHQPAPVHVPAPEPPMQAVSPQAPVHVSPQAPLQMPAPDEPPMHASSPDAPDAPGHMQAPDAPGMPGIQAPGAPGMPGPGMPGPQGPPGISQGPGVGAPGMPGPSDDGADHGFGGFGGSHEGAGGPGGFGGFGGGDHGFGGFGGFGGGGFGGGFGGGGFGGGGGHGGGGGGHR